MLDYSKFQISLDVPEMIFQRVNVPLKILGQTFDPVIRKGLVIRHVSSIGNLHLSIREGLLTIQNSLTKYRHLNNFTNLTYTQLLQAICSIENTLGILIRDANIIYFELGVVIEDNDPNATFSKLGRYKNKQPQLMIQNGSSYGISYSNSLQKIKIYNKAWETKRRYGITLDKKLTRVEKIYTKQHIKSLAKFKNNKIVTIGDLCSRKNLKLLGKDLVESLCKIELRNTPRDTSMLTSKQMRTWGYMQHDPMRDAMKKFHFDAYKKDRADYNKLQIEYRQYQLNEFLEEVQNKILFCLNN